MEDVKLHLRHDTPFEFNLNCSEFLLTFLFLHLQTYKLEISFTQIVFD